MASTYEVHVSGGQVEPNILSGGRMLEPRIAALGPEGNVS